MDLMMVMRKRKETSSLGIHKDSHTISKLVANHPKIRIIHIYAPQIIKTDVANFRELVQRLTGKPSATTPTSTAAAVTDQQKVKKLPRKTSSKPRYHEEEEEITVFRGGFDDKEEEDRMIIKEEEKEEIWRGTHDIMNIDNASGSGGFLSGFSDLDGCFMQQPSSHLMHFFGETQLLS